MPLAKNDALIAQKVRDPKIVQRFWSHIDQGPHDDCWEWQKACNSGGYGIFSIQSWTVVAHRFSYILANGPIRNPALTIDHLCRNRLCVNPGHLDLVSHQINIIRGSSTKLIWQGTNQVVNMLTAHEIGQIAGISTKSITELIRQGCYSGATLCGSLWYVPTDELASMFPRRVSRINNGLTAKREIMGQVSP